MNIFVGNLSFGTTDDGLRQLFEQYGEVTSAKVITSRDTGRSRGFGFVEMSNDGEGRAAIEGLDSTEFEGRPLRVSEARSQGERSGDSASSRW
jgi:RNA recognition motif-containing protein